MATVLPDLASQRLLCSRTVPGRTTGSDISKLNDIPAEEREAEPDKEGYQ